MMTTLNTIEIMDVNPWIMRLFIASVVTSAFVLVLAAFKPNGNSAVAAGILAIILAVATVISLAVLPDIPTGKFQIEATFTDDFPFTSVMKEYEVVEQRGDIFVLEPKEREVD